MTPPAPLTMQSILQDLGADPGALQEFASRGQQAPGTGADLHLVLSSIQAALPDTEALLRHLAPGGLLLVSVPGSPSESELAGLRDRLAPVFHVIAIYRTGGGRTKRQSMGGSEVLASPASEDGVVVALRTRSWVMSPEATVEKFDQNAEGWNGEPGKPGYAHFRWMRRFVALYAPGPTGPGKRVLDFGCGAGWVGIEAAKKLDSPELCFFDPSPEMVRIATDNAKAAGISKATGRTGFGEAPPFPASGEERFDLVISSGVLSFSPDLDAWFDGLARSVKPGGTLIIGDIDPGSRGFGRRRRSRPLLPVRELNGRPASEARERLEGLGFTHRRTSGYQLTFPVPEMMHVSQTKLGGLLSLPLLWANQALAGVDRATNHSLGGWFDSWVMHFDAPKS